MRLGFWDLVLTSARDVGSWHLPRAGSRDGESEKTGLFKGM